MDTIAPINIRERLKDLNTKAYYLLVALSFVYRTKPTLSLKLAITLTAAVAVLPVQDFVKSARLLEGIRRGKVGFLIAAFVCTFWWIWFAAAAPAAAAQKPAPPRAADQQKPKEPASDFDSRLKAAQETADRALMEKDYIERIQKEAKDYYERAFDTQVKFLEWLIILIAAVPIVVGLFGYRTIDRIIEHAVSRATTDLEANFDKKLAAELKELKESNAAQVKELENALTKRIEQADTDLRIRSDFQFQFTQGLSMLGDKRYITCARHFRLAVRKYKEGRERQVVKKLAGIRAMLNIFLSLERKDKANYLDNARKELANELYDGLDEELAQVALENASLRSLILEKQENATTESKPATPTAAPATAQESPTPTTDKTQAAKPEQGENK